MPKEIKNFKIEKYTDQFIKKLYNNEFHECQYSVFSKKNKNFAKIIYDVIKPSSVIDFGCSTGDFIEIFKDKGLNVKGYEYCYETIKNILHGKEILNFIYFGDVTKEIKTDITYNCSVSIEVAEHIPKEYSETFVKTLCQHSNKYIVFTAAQPGQGGTGHINCQEKEFWIKLFKQNSFTLSNELISEVKNKCKPTADKNENEENYVWKHVYNNLLIFIKDDKN